MKNKFDKLKKKFSSEGLLGVLSVFAGGKILSTFLRMMGGFLATRFVDPSDMGTFNGIGLSQTYAGLLQLGIVNGLNRELPYFLGKGDQERAHKLTSVTQYWITIIGGLSFSILFSVGLYKLFIGKYDLAFGWMAYAVSVFFMFYCDRYLMATFRTNKEFNKLAYIDVLQSVSNIGAVVFVKFFGFFGLCLRLLSMTGTNAFFLWKWRPIRVKSYWDFNEFKHLFKIGFPNLIVGQSNVIWGAINSTLLLAWLGNTSLGLYSLAILTSSTLMIVPQSLSQILFPRLSEMIGKGNDLKQLFKFILKPAIFVTLAMVPVVLIGWWALPFFAEKLLPKYVEGVEAAQWALLQVLVLSTASVNNIFSVIKRQDLYLTAAGFGFLAFYLFIYFMKDKGLSLVNFSQAMLLGKSVFMSLSYIFMWYLLRKNHKID